MNIFVIQEGSSSNYEISSASLAALRCPDDTTAQPGQGNLSVCRKLGVMFMEDYGNSGQNLSIEGSFPFSNSGHPGECNMVFCDGAMRFI